MWGIFEETTVLLVEINMMWFHDATDLSQHPGALEHPSLGGFDQKEDTCKHRCGATQDHEPN